MVSITGKRGRPELPIKSFALCNGVKKLLDKKYNDRVVYALTSLGYITSENGVYSVTQIIYKSDIPAIAQETLQHLGGK